MLQVRTLRQLTLRDPATSRTEPVSAASGLALAGEWLYVVADDEHHLAMLRLHGEDAAAPVPLWPGALPTDPPARKAAKADLECLAVLPAGPGFAHGALLVAGSGSRPNRERAALLPLSATGAPGGPVRTLELATLYAPLRAHFPELNIEGLFVTGSALCLLQRGNTPQAVNACIRYTWAAAAQWLFEGGAAPSPDEVQTFDLGLLAGVPLSFTDGCALPDGGWLFSAAAEDTRDSYADGACAGSALGLVSAQGQLRGLHPLDTPLKVEGVALHHTAGEAEVLMVTDADQRGRPAQLLCASGFLSAVDFRPG